MMKRILSFLLALLMVAGMFPTQTFATDSTEASTEPDPHTHIYTDGKCECGEVCAHAAYENGKCTTCGADEPHTHDFTGGACACGEACPHAAYENGKCTTCGADEPAPIDEGGDTTPQCACPEGHDTTAGHVATCPLYTCPDCGAAEYHETCPTGDDGGKEEQTACEICGNDPCTCQTKPEVNYDGDIGKYAKLNPNVQTFFVSDEGCVNGSGYWHDDFTSNTIFRIEGWKVNEYGLWYHVSFYSGSTQGNYVGAFPQEAPWFKQTSAKELVFLDTCATCGKPDCAGHSEPENTCGCCEDCTGAEGCDCQCGNCEFCEKSGFDGENDEFVDSELEKTDGEVTVQIQGYLPTGAELNMTPIDVHNIELGDDDHIYAYDLSLERDGEKIQPGEPVQVTFEGITLYQDGYVEVYHVLDTVAAIQSRLSASNVGAVPSAEFGLSGSAAEQAAFAATGEVGVVYVEVFSSSDGTVSIGDNSASVTVSSFSPYYLVSGNTSIGSVEGSIVNISDGGHRTLYVMPGTTIVFHRGSNYTFWKWSQSGSNVTATTNGNTVDGGWTGSSNDNYEYCTVNVSGSATNGTVAKLVTCRGIIKQEEVTITIEVRSKENLISSVLGNTTYPVFLACLQDSTVIPGEPGVTSAGFYFLNSSYVPQGNFPHFASKGSGVIASNIGSHPNFKASADGTNTMGLVDSTGKTTKAAASGINWDSALRGIVNAGSSVKASDGVTVTSANVEYYEMLPYVIKLQTTTSLGWHIDCMVVPKNTATLSYSLNLPGGNTVSGIALPASVNKPTPFNVTVGAVSVNGTNLAVGSKVQTTDGKAFTFEGWYTNASGTGNRVEIGSNLPITENLILYAKWSGGGYTIGTLIVGKVVKTAANSETPNANDQFTFSIPNLTGSYSYKIYDATTYSEINSGTMTNGTFTLKGNQAIYIENVPVGKYSITETNIPANYTASAATQQVTVAGGIENTVAFTNTYNKPLTYSVTGSIDNGGSVTNKKQTVTHGQSSTAMTFTPATGYKITSVKVNGVEQTGFGENSYTYPAQTNVTGNIEVEVKTTHKTFTVIWRNEDGTVLETDENVTYGTMPSYDGEDPEKTDTAQYTYTFDGWDKNVVVVTGDVTYTAKFSATVNKYTVTFVDENGTTILSEAEYDYDTPADDIEKPADPSKADTDQYTYTFAGWSPAVTKVTDHATYTATYTETLRTYTVTASIDGGGEIVGTNPQTVGYGNEATVVFSPKEGYEIASIKVNDENITDFDPAGGQITRTITCNTTVEITTVLSAFTVTWVDGNGKTLYSETVKSGVTPEYSGTTPTKTATAQYTYTWDKDNPWHPKVVAVTDDATYTAQFTSTVNKYTITWVDGNDNTLKTEQVEYGSKPAYTGEEPTKMATAQYTYTWDKANPWSPKVVAVTDHATYTAQFTSADRLYTITWVDGNGSTLKTEKVAYGSTPAYTGATPTKTGTDELAYTFNNTWSPTVVAVTDDATYTAQFDATTRKYTVTWWQDKNDNGVMDEAELLHTDSDVPYNTMLKYDGTKPEKEPTQQYWYHFAGWEKTDGSTFNAYDEIAVTGDMTFKAILNPTLMEYYVTWLVEGVEKDKDPWKYGDIPSYSGETPTKAEDDGYTYEWKGEWTPVVSRVVDTVTYSAVFEKTAKEFTISYDLTDDDDRTGTVNGTNPVKYTVEDITITLINPTAAQPYYQFAGWTGTDLTDKTMTVTIPTGSTGNREYNANYELIEYQISFDTNGADGAPLAPVPYRYGDNVTLPTVSREGYTYKWKVHEAEGDWTGVTGEVTSGVMNHYGNVVLKAEWTANSYEIRFNKNADAATGTMDNLQMTYDVAQKLTANDFQYTGYTFQGWTDDPDSTQVLYEDQQEVENLTDEDGVVDLYAVWKINTVSLTILTRSLDTNQSYVFQVEGTGLDGTGIELKVILDANDSQTIVDLPAGTYTIRNEQGWSWRYVVKSETKDVHAATVVAEFSNWQSTAKIYWLNGYGNQQIKRKQNSN